MNSLNSKMHDTFQTGEQSFTSLPIYFDGNPYIWLGKRHDQCHQGKTNQKQRNWNTEIK